MKTTVVLFACAIGLAGTWVARAAPIGTAFDYRGTLQDQGSLANGIYDFRFTLFDAGMGGAAVAPAVECSGVNVSNGEFTVRLDFGEQVDTFNGEARWLEVQAKRTNSPTYTTLEPRQPASLTHYALYANYAGGLAADYVYIGQQLEIGDSSPESRLQVNGPSYVYGYSHVEGNLNVVGRVDVHGGLDTTTFNAQQGASFQEGLVVVDGPLEAYGGILSSNGPVSFIGDSGWSVQGGTSRFDCAVAVTGGLETGSKVVVGGYLQGDPYGSPIVAVGDLDVVGVKNTYQAHPTVPGSWIVYTALDGPEAGTYVRGTAQLMGGFAVVPLPEHFAMVTSPEGLTVQLTPRGEPLNLYTVSISPSELQVADDFHEPRYGWFDYLVQGERLGGAGKAVIQQRAVEGESP